MMKMCRYALITALAIFLAGCAGLREQPAPVEEAKPQPQQPRAAAAHGADRTGGALCPGAAWAD